MEAALPVSEIVEVVELSTRIERQIVVKRPKGYLVPRTGAHIG